jgi:branched-subunit amino acid aminotransferase/4-amino-4-deoxychorismate lyase
MFEDAPVLIETMRVRGGELPLLDLHYHRLVTSAGVLGLPVPGPLPLPKGGLDRVLRAQVEVGGVQITERPLGPITPIRLITSQVTHQPYRYKTNARTQFDRTLEEAQAASADDGLLLTAEGYAAETAFWALFWWEGATLCGPPLDLGVLRSVSRARIVRLTAVKESRVTRAGLDGRSLFASNAARGIVPVASLDGKPVPEHPDTPRLQEAFWP